MPGCILTSVPEPLRIGKYLTTRRGISAVLEFPSAFIFYIPNPYAL
jgi:hypothetical protein